MSFIALEYNLLSGFMVEGIAERKAWKERGYRGRLSVRWSSRAVDMRVLVLCTHACAYESKVAIYDINTQAVQSPSSTSINSVPDFLIKL